MNGLLIYKADGTRHRATDAEQREFDSWAEHRKWERIAQICDDINDYKAELRMQKAIRDKGYVQSYTRAQFGWRMMNRPYSAVKYESFIAGEDKYGQLIHPTADWEDFDYAPHGEGTLWRLVPRFRFSGLEVYDVWVITQLPNGKKRRRLIQSNFKSVCESKHCERQSCAYCWAGANLNLRSNEMVKIERREGKLKVDDPSGVSPHGKQNQKAKDMGEDQRAIFGLTSTQQSHKKGASKWR